MTQIHPRLAASIRPFRDDSYHILRLPCCFYLKDSEDKSVLYLNETSALLWELCTGEWDIGEILEMLKEGFPDARDEIEKDVYRIMDMFKEEEVVELRENGQDRSAS